MSPACSSHTRCRHGSLPTEEAAAPCCEEGPSTGCKVLDWGARLEDLLVPRWVRQRSSSREEASAAAMWDAMFISDLQEGEGRGGEGRGRGGGEEETKGGEGRGEGNSEMAKGRPLWDEQMWQARITDVTLAGSLCYVIWVEGGGHLVLVVVHCVSEVQLFAHSHNPSSNINNNNNT